MNILNDKMLKQSLTSAPPARGYLFFGDEDYTKLDALRRLRACICRDSVTEVFNYVHLSPLEFTPERLLSALEPLPMMSDRKLIVVSAPELDGMRADELDALCDVLATLEEYDYNTLVLSVPAGGLDPGRLPSRPSALMKRLGELLTPVQFSRVTPARLGGWVGKHFEHNGVSASPALCTRVVDYCGTSMFKLAGEVDKMSFYVLADGRTELVADDITAAAVPDSEYDAFAFANAITAGDRQRALGILGEMKRKRVDPIMIMGDISRTFCDMLAVRQLSDEGLRAPAIAQATHIHEYRVGLYLGGVQSIKAETLKTIILSCAEADVAVKLSGRGYEPIEQLICGL